MTASIAASQPKSSHLLASTRRFVSWLTSTRVILSLIMLVLMFYLVIILTETLGSIIGDQADVVLAARRGPMAEFHSLVVPMTIINTLLLALANAERDKVMANLDRLDQMRERQLKSVGQMAR